MGSIWSGVPPRAIHLLEIKDNLLVSFLLIQESRLSLVIGRGVSWTFLFGQGRDEDYYVPPSETKAEQDTSEVSSCLLDLVGMFGIIVWDYIF